MAIYNSAREYYLSKIGSYDNLTLRTKEIEQPKANEVLVKVHAVSLNYRDLLVATGRYLASGPTNLVPCSDMAGEVMSVGEDVKDWKVGDRVCANFAIGHLHGDPTAATIATGLGGQVHGVLTEYRTFPANSLVSIPRSLSYEEASTLPCAALTAYNALHGPVPMKAGDYVLVLGTGGVSIFGLQLAVAAGAVVIATSSSDEKLKIASKLGAKHVINYKTQPNWEQEVMKITNGAGVDHVIEVGGQGTLPKSIQSTRPGGQIHIIGFVSQDTTDAGSLVVGCIKGAITLRGIQIGSRAQFVDMNRLIAAHPIVTRPYIDRVFPFEKAKEAYSYLESQAHIGKVVIKVTRD
ncbi:hypothetical protein H2248_011045 [Termitomyces sp. 'cryptogamus']|nr:hypothetical protein H2248_011045 [Termitomyces sp. 'cryptogamus']